MIKLNDAALFSWMTKEKWCWRVEPIPPCGCFQSLTFVSYTRHDWRPLCLYSLYLHLNVNNNSSKALSLSLQAGAGGAFSAGGKCRLLHHPPPGSPQGSPGLPGRLDPHQGHTQPPAHPGHWRPAPTPASMTTAHGLYDHCPLYPRLTCSSPINCQTTGKIRQG